MGKGSKDNVQATQGIAGFGLPSGRSHGWLGRFFFRFAWLGDGVFQASAQSPHKSGNPEKPVFRMENPSLYEHPLFSGVCEPMVYISTLVGPFYRRYIQNPMSILSVALLF